LDHTQEQKISAFHFELYMKKNVETLLHVNWLRTELTQNYKKKKSKDLTVRIKIQSS